MSLSPFAALQAAENRLIPAAFADLRPEWVLEVAPVTSPSPSLDLPRSRVLVNEAGCCWPFRALVEELPLDSDSVPAVLLRHVWQPGMGADPLIDILRVLRPGGQLVSVSANPWHAAAWSELGRAAMWLPSWPHFQLLHGRHRLQVNLAPHAVWRGLVPGLSPVLVLAARKPTRPASVRPLKFRRPVLAAPAGVVSQCRAA